NNSTAVQTPREQEIFLSCLSLFQNRSVGGTNKYNLIPWVLAELALLSHQENATPVIFETSQENIWHPLLEKSKLKHHQSFWKKFFSFTSLGFFIQDREEGWILHIIPKINSGSSYVRISPLLQNYLLKKINQRNQQDLHSFFEKYFQKEFSFISYDQQQIQKMDPEKIAILGEFILQNNYVDFENFMQI
ncbi:MAG: hypothetical protein KBD63_08030, partial [Bacteriovoracaceae bacterium]|nr:hypothetical protein [Bacteriovoracaceae bacterium]